MLRSPLLIALLSGLASATGFAPLSLWPVALISLALLLWLTQTAPSLKSAFLRGWLFGLGHFTLGNNWIQHAFDYQENMPPELGYLAVFLLALYLAIYPALASAIAWKFRRAKGATLPFILAASGAWIVTEYLRAWMFTGYAWSPLSAIWLPQLGVAQLAAYLGTYALSGVTVAVAGTLLLLARKQFVPATVAAVTLAACAVLLHPGAPVDDPSRPLVRIVQPNLGQEGVGTAEYPAIALRKLIALSGTPGDRPRLVVWPEGMVNYYIEDGYDPRYYAPIDPRWVRGNIAAALGPRDMALIGGTALFFDDQGDLSGAGNSVWPINAKGELGQRYDKAHLVPYGEYLPMRSLLEPLGFARLVTGDVDYVAGPGPTAIPVAGFGKIGIAICYEIIFSGQIVDRANRPDMLFNPSNDGWFGSWGPPQHLAQARLRAIEEGLPILRSTPTGISAVIDAHGRILASVPNGQEGAAEVAMPAALPPTWFARIGNWMALIIGLLFFASAVALHRREE